MYLPAQTWSPLILELAKSPNFCHLHFNRFIWNINKTHSLVFEMHRNINWLSHHYQLRENGLNIFLNSFTPPETRKRLTTIRPSEEMSHLRKTLKCPWARQRPVTSCERENTTSSVFLHSSSDHFLKYNYKSWCSFKMILEEQRI